MKQPVTNTGREPWRDELKEMARLVSAAEMEMYHHPDPDAEATAWLIILQRRMLLLQKKTQ